MTRRLPFLLLLVLAGLAGAGEGSARAAENPDVPVLGPLAIAPVTGNLQTSITMTTAGGCPGGTNILVRIYGAGFPQIGENVVGNSETWEYGSPPADRMVVPMTITLEEAVKRQLEPVTLNGTYRINLICRDAIPETDDYEHGDYVGQLQIDSDGNYTALTTDKDLPEEPTPKAGSEAMENPRAHQLAGPEPLTEEELASLAGIRLGAEDDGSSIPFIAAMAGLAGALGLLYVVGRGRRPSGTRR